MPNITPDWIALFPQLVFEKRALYKGCMSQDCAFWLPACRYGGPEYRVRGDVIGWFCRHCYAHFEMKKEDYGAKAWYEIANVANYYFFSGQPDHMEDSELKWWGWKRPSGETKWALAVRCMGCGSLRCEPRGEYALTTSASASQLTTIILRARGRADNRKKPRLCAACAIAFA